MPEKPRFKPKVSRTPTAEDIQKQDIVYRWVDVINARSFLERRIICGEGSITKPIGWFIDKFNGFFHATKFYVDDGIKKEVQDAFLRMRGGNIDVPKMLELFDKYAYECYRKGMFIEEEVIGEEEF